MGLDSKKSVLQADNNNESFYNEKYQDGDLYEVIVEIPTCLKTSRLPALEATEPNSDENRGRSDQSSTFQNDSCADSTQNCSNDLDRNSTKCDLHKAVVENKTALTTTCNLSMLEAADIPSSGENVESTTDQSSILQTDSSKDFSQNCIHNFDRNNNNADLHKVIVENNATLETLCLSMETAECSSDGKLMPQNSSFKNDVCDQSSKDLNDNECNVSEVLPKHKKTVHWNDQLEKTSVYYCSTDYTISALCHCNCNCDFDFEDENLYRFILIVLLIAFLALIWFFKSLNNSF